MKEPTVFRTACELFSGDADTVLEHDLSNSIRRYAEIPYYFFQKWNEGTERPWEKHSGLKTKPKHVELAYRLLFRRFPESQGVVAEHCRGAPWTHQLVDNLIRCPEFINVCAQTACLAFPDAEKVWHFHVPKTAGSTFSAAFRKREWGIVNGNSLDEPRKSLSELVRFMGLERMRRKILFTGHHTLPSYGPLIGPFDEAVCFVRESVDRIVSFWNYMCRVVEKDPSLSSKDARLFIESGLDVEDFEKSYREGRLFRPNPHCFFLSPDASVSGALSNARRVNVDLYEFTEISMVIRDIFPDWTEERVNESTGGLNKSELPSGLRRTIKEDNREDEKLVEYVKGVRRRRA